MPKFENWLIGLNRPRRIALFFALLATAVSLLIGRQVNDWVETRLRKNAETQVATQLNAYVNSLSLAVSQKLTLVSGVSALVRVHPPVENDSDLRTEFDRFAAELLTQQKGIRNIALAPDGVMQFVYPFEENKGVLGYEPALDPRPNVRAEVQRAIEGQMIVLSQPYELIQGGLGLIAREAVFHDGVYWGLTNVVIDVPQLLVEAGIPSADSDLELALTDQAGNLFFGNEAVLADEPVMREIALPEGAWQIAAAPVGGWQLMYQTNLRVFQGMGWLVIFLVGVIVFLAVHRQSRLTLLVARRTQELAESNRKLNQELRVRQQTEAALRNHEAWLELAIEASMGARWFFDVDPASDPPALLDEAYLSPRHKAFAGFTDEEFSNSIRAWEAQILSDDLATVKETSRRVLAGLVPEYHVEYRLRHKDGGIIWISSRGKIQYDENGRPIRFAGLDWDITRRKEAELALKDQSERLEELVAERTQELEEAQEQLIRREKLALLGQLAGSVGHELRTPLGVIKNSAEFLEIVLESPDEEVQEALAILQAEVGASERIISSLLDYARTRQPMTRLIDLRTAVEESLTAVDIPDTIQVEIQGSDPLPIQADPEQIRRILINLIQNAVQAMVGGGRLLVKFQNDREDCVGIVIADTGPGIPAENLKRVFEPLFTTRAKGIGLGLALVRNLVEAHNGSIRVESRVGAGSEFIILFPKNDGDA